MRQTHNSSRHPCRLRGMAVPLRMQGHGVRARKEVRGGGIRAECLEHATQAEPDGAAVPGEHHGML